LPPNQSIAQDTIRFVDVTEQAGLLKPLAGIMGHGGTKLDQSGVGRDEIG
jgi:hypothetical protein